jgi:glyoxylase-like metal-dependent hydrolase (beta-lactamase superfamily II)
MTYWGTNTYIIGDGQTCIVIDPGPDDASHRRAIMKALPPRAVTSHILVTHAHYDHSAGAAALAAQSGAQIYAFGDALSGRSAQMSALARHGHVSGGEGVDLSFAPHHELNHGDTLTSTAGDITALYTPGHMANHLCFVWNGMLFSGDLIMGWSSSLISPPDGDAMRFRESCELLLSHPNMRFLPAHGEIIADGHARVQALLQHRAMREAQIIDILQQAASLDQPLTLSEITKEVYTDIDSRALPAAQRNTLAHLIDLEARGIIQALPELSETAFFHLKHRG